VVFNPADTVTEEQSVECRHVEVRRCPALLYCKRKKKQVQKREQVPLSPSPHHMSTGHKCCFLRKTNKKGMYSVMQLT
jgi:hypothetical protein